MDGFAGFAGVRLVWASSLVSATDTNFISFRCIRDPQQTVEVVGDVIFAIDTSTRFTSVTSTSTRVIVSTATAACTPAVGRFIERRVRDEDEMLEKRDPEITLSTVTIIATMPKNGFWGLMRRQTEVVVTRTITSTIRSTM